MSAKKVVALVVLKDTGEWDISFHKNKPAANKAYKALEDAGVKVDAENPGWVVEKLEDITAEEHAMSIEHLNSVIKQFISPDQTTDDLTSAQNTVWSYLAAGGNTTGEVEATEVVEAAAGTEEVQGETAMAQEQTQKRRPARRDKKKAAAKPAKKVAAKKAAKANGHAREPGKDTKVSKVISMMERTNGATVADICKALDWEPKSVHGVISGILRKKLGLKPKMEKSEKGNIYRL